MFAVLIAILAIVLSFSQSKIPSENASLIQETQVDGGKTEMKQISSEDQRAEVFSQEGSAVQIESQIPDLPEAPIDNNTKSKDDVSVDVVNEPIVGISQPAVFDGDLRDLPVAEPVDLSRPAVEIPQGILQ